MEMQQVRYFIALSRALNFTRAAEAVNVSQPALTRAIQQLEHELGGPLFHRERGNTHLSELGRKMLPYFEVIFSQVEEARNHAQRLKRLDAANLRIGAMPTIGPALLCDLLMKFKANHPSVEFEVSGESSEGVLAALREGRVDVALVAGTEDFTLDFHTIPLAQERLVVVVAPNHPFAAKNVVAVDDLDGQAYIRQSHCKLFETAAHVLSERGLRLQKVLSSERDDYVQAMVQAGMGFAIMPEHCVTDPRLVVRQLIEPEIARTVVLAAARGRPHSPAVSAFIRAVRSTPGAGVETPEAKNGIFVRPRRAPRTGELARVAA